MVSGGLPGCSISPRALRRILASLAIAGTASLGPAVDRVEAHGETTPVIRTVVDGLSAPVAGMSVRILPGLPTNVSLINLSGREVTVVGDLHEPFLRIGARGVFANVNSPTWYGSGNPDGIALNLPRSARAGAPARWRRVSQRPAWSWFDRRVQPPAPALPAQALQGRRPVRLVDWSLPLRYGSRGVEVVGHVEYRPPVGAIVATIRSPQMIAAGVRANVLEGAAPGLYVENTGKSPVTVLGADERPFARIGPAGVSVNVHSAVYLAQQGRVPARADTAAAPLWRQVAAVPRYGWVDARLRYGSLDPPSDVARQTRRVNLRRWSIPIRIASNRHELSGSIDWVPFAAPSFNGAARAAHGDDLARWLVPSVLLAALAALAGLELRRRHARPALPSNSSSAG
ncbi:MAG: hypothetical protein NVS2B6_12080 [Thermoleophilaceae bacterium]